MVDKTVSVRVRFEGGDKVKAGLQEVAREGSRAVEQVGTVSAATGAKLQNAGFQVSDFFVQISSGTDASRALAQQLPQLLQGFGLIGVAVSVLVAALPSLWSLFSSGAEDVGDLAKQLEGVKAATDAYASASEAALEPMDKLIAKYGSLAASVREARLQQAELARGEAQRALQSALGESGFEVSSTSGLAALRSLRQDFRAPSAEMQELAALATDVQGEISEIARQYAISREEAEGLAAAAARVRDSASAGAAEQVAAIQSLIDGLVAIYGSVDAADKATSGLVSNLLDAVEAAANVGAIDMASSIGGAANEAGRLANELMRAASLNYAKIVNMGASGPDLARRSLLARNAPGVSTGTLASGAGGVFRPPAIARGGGGGGGGGAVDPDLARARALTESVRTETEKYAIALEEVNRLKQRGLITDETHARQLDKLNDKLGETGDLGKKAASAIRSAFDGLFDDPQKALQDLSRQLAMMALYQGLARGFPSIFGGGGILPLGIPSFAQGGRHRGGLRIVGENGPELEATGPSMIYPNDALRGMARGGGGTQVIINNNTGQPASEKRSRGPNGQQIIELTVGESIGAGRQDKSLQGRFGVKPQRTVR